MITTEQTVREIAIENPAATKVFERFGIDYCCGGKRPLAEVCIEKGVSIATVLRQLEEIISASEGSHPVIDWQTLPLRDLIDHILEDHHQYTKEALLRLRPLAVKVASRHGERHAEVREIERCFGEMADELDMHLMKEERVLFPHIQQIEQTHPSGENPRRLVFGTVQNPIEMMVAEHDSAGEHLARLRGLTGGYVAPPDACPTFLALYHGLQELEADLHQHIHLENNILFPRAIAMERAIAPV